MFGSVAIELALGLVVLYLLLSTVCSAACEYLLHKFRSRAGLLRSAIRALFATPNGTADRDSVAGFILNHGMFKTSPTRKEPSYVSAKSFAAIVVDGLIPDTAAPNPQPPTVAELRKSAATLPDSPARDALLAIFDSVGENLTRATEEIETWYGDAMERVSGIYKRNAQLVLFLVGIVLAAAINADTIMIARAIATDKELRAQVAAEVMAAARPDASTGTPDDPADRLRRAQEALLGSALPLGWSSVPGDVRALPWSGSSAPAGAPWTEWRSFRCFFKLLGLLITAGAVSFGAPFWFDVLNRVSNLRAGGPKPKRPNVAA